MCFIKTLLTMLLGLINTLLFLIGAAIVIITCLLKWSKISEQIKIINDMSSVLDLTTLNTVSIVLICIGSFILLISIIGFVGTCLSNRVLLGIYAVAVLLLFIANLIALILLLTMTSRIEQEYKTSLNSTVNKINQNPTDAANIILCGFMRSISSFFTCCGAQGPQDFTSQTVRIACCSDSTVSQGCAQTSFDWLKKNSVYFLIIPTSVILFFELVTIFIVVFLIHNITKSLKQVA
jgi:hypothetical protein